MGFRINTNIDALSAHASATQNNRALSSSLGRLNSGLRIQSAADDASGLAIADSLRSQASSLTQAISNGNDAIGIIQTADKAMDEQLKILDTIKAKSVQAAQDGQTAETRKAIQADISRLMEELDMIGNTTSFNGQKLLSGSFTNKEFQVGAYSNETVKASIGPTTSDKIGLTRFETGAVVKEGTLSKIGDLKAGQSITFLNVDGVNDIKLEPMKLANFGGTFNGSLSSIKTADLAGSIDIKKGMGLGGIAEAINRVSDQTGIKATATVETIFGAIKAGKTTQDFSINGVKIGEVEIKDNDSNGALRAAINAVKDKTGVEASVNERGELVLNNTDGRGIMVTGKTSVAGSTGMSAITTGGSRLNFGRLSLVRLGGNDIQVKVGNSAYSVAMVSANFMLGFRSGNNVVMTTAGAKPELATEVLSSATGATKAANNRWYTSANVRVDENGAAWKSTAVLSVGDVTSQKTVSLREMNGGKITEDLANAMGFYSGGWGNYGKDQGAGVTTLKGAMAMMNVAETAQKALDAVRSDLGSVQKQLEATVNNITVTQVNVKSAESNIRDVDFAAESATFSKHNILAQSGTYAMSQANATAQNVMRLLQ